LNNFDRYGSNTKSALKLICSVEASDWRTADAAFTPAEARRSHDCGLGDPCKIGTDQDFSSRGTDGLRIRLSRTQHSPFQRPPAATDEKAIGVVHTLGTIRRHRSIPTTAAASAVAAAAVLVTAMAMTVY
jgi:hypothetical protein